MPQSVGFPATDQGGSLGGTTLLRQGVGQLLVMRPGWLGGQERIRQRAPGQLGCGKLPAPTMTLGVIMSQDEFFKSHVPPTRTPAAPQAPAAPSEPPSQQKS